MYSVYTLMYILTPYTKSIQFILSKIWDVYSVYSSRCLNLFQWKAL